MTAGLFNDVTSDNEIQLGRFSLANYAILGDIEFSNITSFTGYSETQSYNFVEDETLKGRPTLQQVGGELKSVSIEVTFYANFIEPLNPRKEAQKLEDEAERIRETAEPASLVYGGRFMGEYVIDQVQKTYEKTLPSWQGSEPTVVSVTMELRKLESKLGSNTAQANG